MRLGKTLLLVAIAGIAGVVLLDKPAPPAGGVARDDGVAPPHESGPDSLKLAADRHGLPRARGELFVGAPPVQPAPVPAPAPVAAPPAPVAPPVPYRFAGKVIRGSDEEVLVAKGDAVIPVRIGDTIDGMYRVDSIGRERIEFLYLPLGTRDRIVAISALDAAPVAAPVVAARPRQSPAPAAVGQPARLRWEGPERVEAGASFNVALRVSTSEALRAAPMQLRYEPGVLEPVTVRPGKFFGQGSFTYRVNPEGSIYVGATSQAGAPGADAELVIVTFRPIKRGATAELSMSALSLQGAAGRAIAHEQVSAFRTAIR